MPKSKLITSAPLRLFTFGCSFTGFKYPTWAEVLGFDLDAEFYNYGKSGAGNSYMFNMLMQADSYFHFGPQDLIVICWTNFAREDRFRQGAWHTPGNIYTQKTYSKDWVRDWADVQGFVLRDMASIKAAYELLLSRGCQFHFLSMLNLFENVDQWNATSDEQMGLAQIQTHYQHYVDQIQPSFYQILWNNNIQDKFEQEQSIHPKLRNGHPTPAEHLAYLQAVFDHEFRNDTLHVINQAEDDYQKIVKTFIKRTSFDFLDFTPCWYVRSLPAPSLLT